MHAWANGCLIHADRAIILWLLLILRAWNRHAVQILLLESVLRVVGLRTSPHVLQGQVGELFDLGLLHIKGRVALSKAHASSVGSLFQWGLVCASIRVFGKLD